MPEMLLKTDSHCLKLKTYFVTDSATEFFIDTYRKPLGFTTKRLRNSFMLKPNPSHTLLLPFIGKTSSFKKNRLHRRLQKYERS